MFPILLCGIVVTLVCHTQWDLNVLYKSINLWGPVTAFYDLLHLSNEKTGTVEDLVVIVV